MVSKWYQRANLYLFSTFDATISGCKAGCQSIDFRATHTIRLHLYGVRLQHYGAIACPPQLAYAQVARLKALPLLFQRCVQRKHPGACQAREYASRLKKINEKDSYTAYLSFSAILIRNSKFEN